MKTKKIMGIIALVIVCGVGLLIAVIYATVRTKSASLNKHQPFENLIGETVTLHTETVLFVEKLGSYQNNQYPYILLYSLHPQWPYVNERLMMEKPDLEKITTFPAGTKLKVEKAVQYTTGVSGSSYPVVFGTITIGQKSYKIGYQWGEMSIEKHMDKIEKCWSFHQAPWQEQPDTAFYALPIAKIW